MSGNTFGTLFTVTTFGESHGPAIGCIVDGCPPGLELREEDIQPFLDKRKPGQSKYTTQRREDDKVQILSGVFEGKTTGTPIALLIPNMDQRSRDYEEIKDLFRPGHADFTYHHKYGHRDYRGEDDLLHVKRQLELLRVRLLVCICSAIYNWKLLAIWSKWGI